MRKIRILTIVVIVAILIGVVVYAALPSGEPRVVLAPDTTDMPEQNPENQTANDTDLGSPEPTPSPLLFLFVRTTIVYADGTERVLTQETPLFTIFVSGENRAVKRFDYEAEIQPNTLMTSRGEFPGTEVYINVTGGLGETSKFIRAPVRTAPADTRTLIAGGSIFDTDMENLADGAYTMTFALRLVVDYTNADDKAVRRTFWVTFPTISLSLQTLDGGGGGGGGCIKEDCTPAPLTIGVDFSAGVSDGYLALAQKDLLMILAAVVTVGVLIVLLWRRVL